MKFYIDYDFKCHVNGDDTMTMIESSFFDGKCAAFIEGYRFIPTGQNWTRDDGTTFMGEMAAPWKPYDELDAAQREYEFQLLKDMEAALNELGVYV